MLTQNKIMNPRSCEFEDNKTSKSRAELRSLNANLSSFSSILSGSSGRVFRDGVVGDGVDI
jgi:hypothetical protein